MRYIRSHEMLKSGYHVIRGIRSGIKGQNRERINTRRSKIPDTSNIEATELTEQERIFIKELEKSNTLADTHKIDLLLAWRKRKPISIIEFMIPSSVGKDKTQREETERRKSEVKNTYALIRSMGLTVEMQEPYILTHDDDEKTYHHFPITVASSKSKAQRFTTLLSKKEDSMAIKAQGIMLGYPATASAAYAAWRENPELENELVLDKQVLPSEIRGQEYMAFLQFRLSRDHWEQELETVKQWADTIRSISPTLYAATIKHYKEWRSKEEYEQWLRDEVRDYKAVFALTDNDIRGKKILEVGAGDRRFAATCMINGLTQDVYSLEPALSGEEKSGYHIQDNLYDVINRVSPPVRKNIEEKTIIATAEATGLPDQSFDLVISRSVPTSSDQQLRDRLMELLRVGKEVRIYPVVELRRDAFEQAVSDIQRDVSLTAEFIITLDTDIRTEQGVKRVKEAVLILHRHE